MHDRWYYNRDWFYNQYWIKEKSLRDIGRICNMAPQTVMNWMKKIGVPTRSRKKSLWARGYREKRSNIMMGNTISPSRRERWSLGKDQLGFWARKVWGDWWNQGVPRGYCVHHIDENLQNNEISNLALLTISEHTKIHYRRRNSRPLK